MIQILSLVIVIALVKTTTAKAYKRVVVHVPMKVKHHHHTHTVFKHVHHSVPVHYDHHDVHVIHPETAQDDYDTGEYHIPHGTTLESIMGDHGSYYDSSDRAGGYDDVERYLRKRSKSKQKLFNNMVIGWKGRSDFDKIASEYLASIKRQRTPETDYNDRYAAYDDDESKRK